MKVLEEREKTHGDFERTAQVAQMLKRYMDEARGCTDVQWEALHMIASKLARIICGNPHEEDHWRDIAGYAKLVAKNIKKRKKTSP
jgi:hypothetical protein